MPRSAMLEITAVDCIYCMLALLAKLRNWLQHEIKRPKGSSTETLNSTDGESTTTLCLAKAKSYGY